MPYFFHVGSSFPVAQSLSLLNSLLGRAGMDSMASKISLMSELGSCIPACKCSRGVAIQHWACIRLPLNCRGVIYCNASFAHPASLHCPNPTFVGMPLMGARRCRTPSILVSRILRSAMRCLAAAFSSGAASPR